MTRLPKTVTRILTFSNAQLGQGPDKSEVIRSIERIDRLIASKTSLLKLLKRQISRAVKEKEKLQGYVDGQ